LAKEANNPDGAHTSIEEPRFYEEDSTTVTVETLEASASAGGRPSEGVGRKLRVFISSPGDVGQERLIAARVLERLQGEFWGVFELEPIVWEHEPLRASAHFQEQILPPS